MTRALTVTPVVVRDEVVPGTDLAHLIAANCDLEDGDVLVVAQKAVSKAEGRVIDLPPGEDPAEGRRRVAAEQARRVVADTPGVLIVETPHGLVCANGGIDASNTPAGTLVLLPEAPDGSARRLRSALAERTGRTIAVIISDTFGRPWRMGQTDVAIGAAGIAPLRDERGSTDRHGHRLEVTEAAIADELAGAADLVRRKADGALAVVVRGLDHAVDEHAGAAALIRPPAQDLFRRGRGMLARSLGAPPPPGAVPVSAAAMEQALAAARRVGGGDVTLEILAGEARIALDAAGGGTAGAAPTAQALRVGAAAMALVAAVMDLDGHAVTRPPHQGEPGLVVVEVAR